MTRNPQRLRTAWCTAFLCLAAAVPCRAQDYESGPQGYIGVHGAFTKARGAEDGNFLGGMHLELLMARILGVQGAIGYRSEEKFEVPLPSGPASLNVRIIPVTVSGKVYLPVAPTFSPYGVAGAGWYHTFFDYSAPLEATGLHDQDTNTFGWHLGAGLNLMVSPRVGLFAEGRWAFLDPNEKLDSATRDRLQGLDFDTFHALAGFNFGF